MSIARRRRSAIIACFPPPAPCRRGTAEVLGMKLIRTRENPEYKYTLAFLGESRRRWRTRKGPSCAVSVPCCCDRPALKTRAPC